MWLSDAQHPANQASAQACPSTNIWVWLNRRGYARFGPCFHLLGQPFLEFRLFEPQPYHFFPTASSYGVSAQIGSFLLVWGSQGGFRGCWGHHLAVAFLRQAPVPDFFFGAFCQRMFGLSLFANVDDGFSSKPQSKITTSRGAERNRVLQDVQMMVDQLGTNPVPIQLPIGKAGFAGVAGRGAAARCPLFLLLFFLPGWGEAHGCGFGRFFLANVFQSLNLIQWMAEKSFAPPKKLWGSICLLVFLWGTRIISELLNGGAKWISQAFIVG